MHASISHLRGDPDDLLRRYDALLAEIPAEGMILHLCLRGLSFAARIFPDQPHFVGLIGRQLQHLAQGRLRRNRCDS